MTMLYALHPIKITGKAGDYQAIVHFTRSVGLEEVIERMIEQNPGLTRPLVQAMINGYHTAITSLALEGCKINTPTVNHGVSIKGLFDSPGDSFSPDRHQVLPTVSPGKEMLRAMRLARTRKLPTRTPGPEPQEYNDLTSQSRDHRISPGQPAHLFGFSLKFNPADTRNRASFLSLPITTPPASRWWPTINPASFFLLTRSRFNPAFIPWKYGPPSEKSCAGANSRLCWK